MASGNAPARRAQFNPADQHRRSMIAKIQVARQQLQMMEDDYRQGMLEKTGRTSLKDCSDAQLAQMLDWLKSKGFRPIARKGVAMHPMARKARALWISLHKLGVVHNPSEQALEAFAKRQLGCEKLVWARQSDAYRLIEALKSMAERAGWRQHNIATQRMCTPIELQSGLCQAILVKLKEAGIAPADWGLHDAMWKLCGIENARERAWTAEDYARLAAALGEKLRRHGGAKNSGGANG